MKKKGMNKHIKRLVTAIVVVEVFSVSLFLIPNEYLGDFLKSYRNGFEFGFHSATGGICTRGRDSERLADSTLLKDAEGGRSTPVRDSESVDDATTFPEDDEGVIRLFESQPEMHSNSTAIVDYVKALVRVGRLEESELFKTVLEKGTSSASTEQDPDYLGTARDPFHMVIVDQG
ncbi:ATP-dependent zinc metalloprotease FTSH 5, mitochondrial-like, partial [Papaver somniferum]